MECEGILVVDKPAGWTSHDVVKKTSFMLGQKVGHTGTLDPFATGVLVLMVGKATKAAERFVADEKEYDAAVTFGTATDTYDCTGKTTASGDPSEIDQEKLRAIIQGFIGESDQLPPPYSAKKVGGKKLYQLARAGKTIELTPHRIRIRAIETDFTRFPTVGLRLTCSKGTYVRSIAEDLGRRVGCPAHLSALRRTRAGVFRIEDAAEFIEFARTNDREGLASRIRSLDTVTADDCV